MGWREQLQPASFRGVAFRVDTAELSGGRRTVRHEFPRRDESFSEDLGRKTREFSLDAFVVGLDYLDQKNALLAVLEQSGPGELVHPYYGTRRVVCSDYRVRETTTDGGMAVFSLSFEETETAPAFPATGISGVELVNLAGLLALEQERKKATEAGTFALPAAALASLGTVLSDAAASVDAALAPLVSDAQQAAGLRRQAASIASTAASLARTPVDALEAMLDLVAELTLPARLGVDALLSVFGRSPSASRPPATTAARVQERAAYDLLLEQVRLVAAVRAAQLAPAAEYDSYEDAVAVRDSVAEALDSLADSADDGIFDALEQLRADLVRAVPGDESDLPRIVRHTPAATAPSLVLAHRLYGTVDKEADLLARNRISRPGFVPGGVELEVLSDG